jgi:hypothetical protein
MGKCYECKTADADNEIRYFRDRVTGIVYEGRRQFCCDVCEEAYCQKSVTPEVEERFHRIDPALVADAKLRAKLQPRTTDPKLLN